MTKKTYLEQLRDPRWQKRRLEILERDEFQCQNCGSEDSELQIHHLAYRQNTAPWDYENNELITLCKDCHSENTKELNEAIEFLRKNSFAIEIISQLNAILKFTRGFDPYDLQLLIEHIVNYKNKRNGEGQ